MTTPVKNAGGRGRRKLLLAGIALAALGLAGSTGLRAHAAGVLSQGGGATIAPVPSSVTANLLAQQQGAAVAAQAQDQLARITTALQAMQTMQTAAHNLALTTPSSVPDGLQTGGLVPDSGLAAPGVANPVTTWTGANAPTQTSSAGKTTVTINQTAAQALLSWNSFNVSPGTTVDFNQQGNTDWVALNQIAASGDAERDSGIDQGKRAGLSDQSERDHFRRLVADQCRGADRLLGADQRQPVFQQWHLQHRDGNRSQAVYAPSFTNAGGTISVQAGAEIVANGPSTVTNGGGYVLLMGTQVNNGGSISTPQGQAELAAGDNFILRQGVVLTTNDSITTSSTAGNEIAVQLKTLGSSVNPGGSGSGLVVNTGEITADTGDITLAGETINQDGVLLSTTSTAYRGTIHLLSSASIRIAASRSGPMAIP